MAEDIKSPVFPESVFEGTLSNWLKKEGESFKQDEILAEIETDKAIMELIPTSHNHTVINYGDLMKFYNSRIKIILNPGDILLINSAILHRGIYYKKMADNRRLIQLFDCMFLDDYKNLAKYIFHTQHKKDNLVLSAIMQPISKIKPFISKIHITSF